MHNAEIGTMKVKVELASSVGNPSSAELPVISGLVVAEEKAAKE